MDAFGAGRFVKYLKIILSSLIVLFLVWGLSLFRDKFLFPNLLIEINDLFFVNIIIGIIYTNVVLIPYIFVRKKIFEIGKNKTIVWSVGITIFIIISAIALNEISFSESLINKTLIAGLIFLSVGILEEVFYRGILYEYIKKNWNVSSAAFISSAVFSLSHIPFLKEFSANNLIALFLMGILFCFLYSKLSIYFVIVFHWFWNALGAGIMTHISNDFYIVMIVIQFILFISYVLRAIYGTDGRFKYLVQNFT